MVAYSYFKFIVEVPNLNSLEFIEKILNDDSKRSRTAPLIYIFNNGK